MYLHIHVGSVSDSREFFDIQFRMFYILLHSHNIPKIKQMCLNSNLLS